jgi:hypothetical protein
MNEPRSRFSSEGRLRRRGLFFGLVMAVIVLSMSASAVRGAPASFEPDDPGSGEAGFLRQRVDAPRLFHSMSSRSLRLDEDGNPHVAYGGDHLYYATNQGSSWAVQTEVVDSSPGVGAYASLALDINNNPHISYYDAINGALKYAVKIGGGWQIQTVDSAAGGLLPVPPDADFDGSLPPSGDADLREWRYFLEPTPELQEGQETPLRVTEDGVGLQTSIAVDAFAHPSITYYDSINKDLKYAHWTGSAWDIMTVDEEGDGDDGDWGQFSSLTLDTNGTPHISFYDATKKDLFYGILESSGWDWRRLDSADDVGMYNSIFLDSNNRPHISYYDNTNGNLEYIRKSGNTWTSPVTVDSGGNVGLYSSLGLANRNSTRPFIAYYDATRADLKYAYFSTTTNAWVRETIFADEFVGRFPSLALNAGSPRISYFDSGLGQFRYAVRTGTRSWKAEIIDRSSDVGPFSSLAFDNAGQPHISYYDDVHDNLKYAHLTGGSWAISTVDNTGSVGLYTSLKLDGAGNPHISYFDSKEDDIKYARWTGSGWHIQIVDNAVNSSGEVGMNTSLVLNSQDMPRVAYFDGKNDDLKVALWTGSSWLKRVVDDTDNKGRYPSMAIDNQDNLHLSYYNATGGSLRYAKGTADGSSWDRMNVDAGGTGLYTSITLDNANFPHISYFEDTGDNLRYARWNGTGWELHNVDSEGVLGWYTSIALDNLGRPHITYYDYGNRSLKYTQLNGATWQFQILDNLGEVGQYSSIAFSPAGNPAVSYYDATNGDLKYAYFNPINFSYFLYLPTIE